MARAMGTIWPLPAAPRPSCAPLFLERPKKVAPMLPTVPGGLMAWRLSAAACSSLSEKGEARAGCLRAPCCAGRPRIAAGSTAASLRIGRPVQAAPTLPAAPRGRERGLLPPSQRSSPSRCFPCGWIPRRVEPAGACWSR